jgi:hypothetical protein
VVPWRWRAIRSEATATVPSKAHHAVFGSEAGYMLEGLEVKVLEDMIAGYR